MAKPLSQSEIDSLLEIGDMVDAMAGSTPDPKDEKRDPIRPYNFKRPRLFSQDQMRVLNHVHESFARDLSVYFSAQLRTIVDISLTAVEQLLYSEYVMSSAPPSALYEVEVVNMEHKIVFEIDPRFVIFTIEKLFGGAGVFLQQPREVSRIEQRVMGKVIRRSFEKLEEAWSQACAVTLAERSFESNAEFVQIVPLVEPTLVAAFEVAVYGQQSYISICYPCLLLERMLSRAGMKQWVSSATTQASPKARQRFEEAVSSTTVELSAELGRTHLPVSVLSDLQCGDVIPLVQRTEDAVPVHVNGRPKFKADIGRSGRYRALRIVEVNPPLLLSDTQD